MTEDTPCIIINRPEDGFIQVTHERMLPHYVSCRLYRWPDLHWSCNLSSVQVCEFPASRLEETNRICINLYHYARVTPKRYNSIVEIDIADFRKKMTGNKKAAGHEKAALQRMVALRKKACPCCVL